MKCPLLFFTIFYLIKVGSGCDAPAIPHRQDITDLLTNQKHWTAFTSPPNGHVYPFQTVGQNVVYKFLPNHTQYMNVILNNGTENETKTPFLLNAKKYIFSSTYSSRSHNRFHFALSSVCLSTDNLIFVSCDRSVSWIQMPEEQYRIMHENRTEIERLTELVRNINNFIIL